MAFFDTPLRNQIKTHIKENFVLVKGDAEIFGI